METRARISVFEYMDYRKFLGDYYQFKKSLNRHFSHRLFALKAGIKSTGYFSEVLHGRRNLSKAQSQKFCKAMDLGEKEQAYFELLVDFCHAQSAVARQSIYESMLKAMPIKVQQVRQSQLEYFSTWYHVAVREALAIVKIKGKGDELAGLLDPPITAAQARSAIKLLQTLGLIVADPEGYWKASHVSLLSPEDPGSSLLLRAFQGEMMGKAREALDRVPQEARDISCVTMSVSGEGLGRIKGLVSEFHKRVLETVQTDRGEDRVVQLNLQVFPLTRIKDVHAVAAP
jgi:uncharacterized protein (TIGR02147 family)